MIGVVLLVNVLGLLRSEPKDTDKVVDLFNDGNTPVTITMAGSDVKLAPHEKSRLTLTEFGTYVVVLDNGGFRTHSRSLVLGDEDGLYTPPKAIHWCIVARNSSLNLLQRQECAARVGR